MKVAWIRGLVLGGAAALALVQPSFAAMAASSTPELEAEAFGAVPDDGRDDTAALRALWAAASRQRDTTVRLRPGRYEVSSGSAMPSRQPVFAIADADGLAVEAAGAWMEVTGIAPLFDIRRSRRVRFAGLTVDWAVRPAVGVRVVRVEPDRVVLAAATPGRVVSGVPPQSLYLYDERASRPAAGRPNRYWIEGATPPPIRAEPDGTWSVPLRGYDSPLADLGLQVGDSAVLRFAIYGCNTFTFTGSDQVNLENITLLASPGMGVVGVDSTDLTLQGIRVFPAPGQWISTCADATHFVACRGTVTLRDCQFEAMGDDGMNLRSDLFRVRALGPEAIILERGKNPQAPVAPVPRAGDELAFAPASQPLAFAAGVVVRQAAPVAGQPSVRVTLAAPVPAGLQAGATVANWSATAGLVVERVKVSRNHGRGLLIQTPRPVRVADCRFEQQSGSAIQITSDVRQWWEGPPVREVRIERSRFIGGNDGAARHGAVLSIYADEAAGEATVPVHQGITIADCVFESYGDAAIRVASASSVHIAGNTFHGAGHPITEWHARGVELLDNRLVPPSP